MMFKRPFFLGVQTLFQAMGDFLNILSDPDHKNSYKLLQHFYNLLGNKDALHPVIGNKKKHALDQLSPTSKTQES